ncbi:MAG: glycosyltransferase N-terminal domain-containing protein [Chthoniobacterales bacterium]
MLIFLYNLFLPVALLISFPFYLRRMLKRGGYARNFLQRFGFFSTRLRRRFSEGRWTWVRAVSVGEMILALRLIRRLKERDPAMQAVISTTTSTGYALGLKQVDPTWTEVIYSPIDFYPIVSWAWRRINPVETLLVDSDLWPSFLAIAARKRVPNHLTNARLSPRSERRYQGMRLLSQELFWKKLTTVCAQDENDAVRWESLGVSHNRIFTTGSIKYDLAETEGTAGADFSQWLRSHGFDLPRLVLLGGSLHPGEEQLLVNCYLELTATFPDLFLILAPRHAERTPEIERLLQRANIRYALRSNPGFGPDTSTLVLDSTGELRDWYRTATVVVMGKSFRGVGGQNPVEPILAGKPVICGPHMENFDYLIRELRAAGGVVQLESESELVSSVAHLLVSPERAARLVTNAKDALMQHRGATDRTVELILRARQQH